MTTANNRRNALDGGEAILEAFRQLRVDYVTSSPGSEWAPVWEALARQKVTAKEGPTYIDCGHEGLAVNIAHGYTQVTGKMQAVLLHAGAGVLQGALAIRGAYVAEIPMVIMAGQSDTVGEDPSFEPGLQWYRNLGVVGGPERLVEPIVKWAGRAAGVHTLFKSVTRSGEMAVRAPNGPVFLSVSVEAMLQGWTPPAESYRIPSPPKTRPTQEDVETVATLLRKAKNPVIVTETAGRSPAAFAALVELAEFMSIPVVEARTVLYANFPKDHPLHLGTDLNRFVKEADFFLLVSTRVPWYPPSSSPDATIVAISDNPLKGFMVYQNLDADIYLEGDVGETLRVLTAALRAGGVKTDAYAERFAHWSAEHAQLQKRVRASEAKVSFEGPVDPLALFSAMRELMPEDAIYVDETIVHSPQIQRHLSWNKPQSFFKSSPGLGQGIGLSLGVKLATPQRLVTLLIGDGSFLYNPVLPALLASKTYKLPILIIVCNNGQYQAMKENHVLYYPDGISVSENLYYGVAIDGPDYSDAARMAGGYGRRVENAADLKDALREAIAAVNGGRTAILNVVVTDELSSMWQARSPKAEKVG